MRIGTNHGSLSDRDDEPLRRHARAAWSNPRSSSCDICEDENLPRRRPLDEARQSAGRRPGLPAARGVARRAQPSAQRRASGRSAIQLPVPPRRHRGRRRRGRPHQERDRDRLAARRWVRRHDPRLADGGSGEARSRSRAAIAKRVERRWADADREPGAIPDPGAPFLDDPYEHVRRATKSVACGAIDLGGDGAGARRTRDRGPAGRSGRRRVAACGFARGAARRSLRGFAPRRRRRSGARADPNRSWRRWRVTVLARRWRCGWRASRAPRRGTSRRAGSSRSRCGRGRAARRRRRAAAEAAGVALECRRAGRRGRLVSGVARLRSLARGEADARLASVEGRLPVPAVRLVAARMRARGWPAPIVLVHRSEAARDRRDELLPASVGSRRAALRRHRRRRRPRARRTRARGRCARARVSTSSRARGSA